MNSKQSTNVFKIVQARFFSRFILKSYLWNRENGTSSWIFNVHDFSLYDEGTKGTSF